MSAIRISQEPSDVRTAATSGLLPLGMALSLLVFPEVLLQRSGASLRVTTLVEPRLCAGLTVFFALYFVALSTGPRSWPRGLSVDGAAPGKPSLGGAERALVRQAITWGIILGVVGGPHTASRLLWGLPSTADLWVAASCTLLGHELLQARSWPHVASTPPSWSPGRSPAPASPCASGTRPPRGAREIAAEVGPAPSSIGAGAPEAS